MTLEEGEYVVIWDTQERIGNISNMESPGILSQSSFQCVNPNLSAF